MADDSSKMTAIIIRPKLVIYWLVREWRHLSRSDNQGSKNPGIKFLSLSYDCNGNLQKNTVVETVKVNTSNLIFHRFG